ncbi:MAG: hypothetical protein LBT03_01120 [Holosporales bacterium]|jgi:hypothetical protein|nr:hypothetical protein [Holosporales bacterium]
MNFKEYTIMLQRIALAILIGSVLHPVAQASEEEVAPSILASQEAYEGLVTLNEYAYKYIPDSLFQDVRKGRGDANLVCLLANYVQATTCETCRQRVEDIMQGEEMSLQKLTILELEFPNASLCLQSYILHEIVGWEEVAKRKKWMYSERRELWKQICTIYDRLYREAMVKLAKEEIEDHH